MKLAEFDNWLKGPSPFGPPRAAILIPAMLLVIAGLLYVIWRMP